MAVVGSSWLALEARGSQDEIIQSELNNKISTIEDGADEILQSELKERGASTNEVDREIKTQSCESQKTWPISTEENGVSNLTKEDDENNNQRISETLPSLECDGDKILEEISSPCETAKELDIKDNQEDLKQSSDVMEGESNPLIDALEPEHVGSVIGQKHVTLDEEDRGDPPHNDKVINVRDDDRKEWVEGLKMHLIEYKDAISKLKTVTVIILSR